MSSAAQTGIEQITCLRHGNRDNIDAVIENLFNYNLQGECLEGRFPPYTGSSEALLSGQKPPFRLLCRATSKATGARLSNIKFAVSEPFVVRLCCCLPNPHRVVLAITITDTLHSLLMCAKHRHILISHRSWALRASGRSFLTLGLGVV